MNDQPPPSGDTPGFFDGFTRTALATMAVILTIIFASASYMASNKMGGKGTDDAVNNLAAAVTRGEHHPFVELPGDAELGAFSVANFFAGLIVGYHWLKLFGARPQSGREKKEDRRG